MNGWVVFQERRINPDCSETQWEWKIYGLNAVIASNSFFRRLESAMADFVMVPARYNIDIDNVTINYADWSSKKKVEILEREIEQQKQIAIGLRYENECLKKEIMILEEKQNDYANLSVRYLHEC